ncbi:17127_t:CDS:2 [Funneliformis geosporum]|nr:17127_t:CDS:2 [Funneliformis geosporum]
MRIILKRKTSPCCINGSGKGVIVATGGSEHAFDHKSRYLFEAIQDSWSRRQPRTEIPEVIKECCRARMRAFMVSDYALTAETTYICEEDDYQLNTIHLL